MCLKTVCRTGLLLGKGQHDCGHGYSIESYILYLELCFLSDFPPIVI